MSRTIKIAQAGGPEVLEFIESPVRAPGPHEVRILVKAIGINRACGFSHSVSFFSLRTS
jgi:NADPH:quinone reductase-like Zn-dependent oxidoreductase